MAECDFPIHVTIGRPSLGLGNLFLNADTGWSFDRNGIGNGEKTMRRTTVETPYVNGRTLVHAVPDTETATIKAIVKGANPTDVISKINVLEAAVSQFQYLMAVEIAGYTWIWNCEPADMTIGDGGAYEDLWLRSNMQRVTLSVPHKPT